MEVRTKHLFAFVAPLSAVLQANSWMTWVLADISWVELCAILSDSFS